MKVLRGLALASLAVVMAACSTTPSSDAPAAKAKGTNLNGTSWVITTDTPMGPQDSDITVAQEGEKITGKMSNPMLGELPYTGTLVGNAIKFGIEIDMGGQKMQIDYAGTVDASGMAGVATFGPMGEGKFTGKKKGS
jgi:hypothetical protein